MNIITTEFATLNDSNAYDDVVSNTAFEARGMSSGESPPSTTSPKRCRRAIQKRVVKVPIKEMDGAHFNKQGEYCTNPPSDSWAWRKYGQKPIKGSPFPRGYYRCSSSKGCPARKQVERSRSDPTILLITYSYDHNHSFPLNSRTHHKNPIAAAKPESTQTIEEPPQITGTAVKIDPTQIGSCQEKFADLAGEVESLITADDFAWTFSDLDATSSGILGGSVFSRTSSGTGSDLTGYFPMREEDESLFADLGELPECSVVFGMTDAREEECRRRYDFMAAAPWCRTTG